MSLMFGRSAGLIGAMIAMGILITSSVTHYDASGKLSADSHMFLLIRTLILIQAGYMGALFFYKTRNITTPEKRFNLIQYALMQSTLLIFIVLMAVGQDGFYDFPQYDLIPAGGVTLLTAPAQIFVPVDLYPADVTFAVILIWCVSGAINAYLIGKQIKFGWIGDHGEG
ncbi:MAG: hypothetical protein EOP60_00890, partial [Sphingomonadales bacterium]